MSIKEDFEYKIAREDLRLAKLDGGIAATTARLSELRKHLDTQSAVQGVVPRKPILTAAGALATNAVKIVFIRSLFRGCDDNP